MKESKVLVINLRSVSTELTRHLVLSGINIDFIEDFKRVEVHNLESDFLFNNQDLGLLRGEVIHQKLSEMNPFAKIVYLKESSIKSILEGKILP
jgi:molybdopterin/thiamine biosynthesis adenylyltransferase